MPPTRKATTNPHLHCRLLDTPRQVSCGVTAPFSWFLVHKVLSCPPRVYFPVLCKFWQVYSGVNGDLLQEVIPTLRAPVPVAGHCQLVLSSVHRRHSNTVLSQSLWGLQVLVHIKLFEPSEHLWQVWGLILNVNSPFLSSCWGFSFALGHGVSPHSCSSK